MAQRGQLLGGRPAARHPGQADRRGQRVVGLYDGDKQIGFCRAASDGVAFVYPADVYVLEEYRGRGLGEALVGFMVDESPYVRVRWILHTTNMHALYRKFGFGEPDYKVLERRATSQESASG